MNKSDVLKLIQDEYVPEYTLIKSSLFKLTDCFDLLGISIESSAYHSRRFYIWAYWIPLYAPTEQIYFNNGSRLNGENGELWDLDELDESKFGKQIRKPLSKWISATEKVSTRLKALRKNVRTFGTLRDYCTLFYTLTRTNDLDEARFVYEEVAAKSWRKPWQKELIGEIKSVVDLFECPKTLDEKLIENIDRSIQHLEINRMN